MRRKAVGITIAGFLFAAACSNGGATGRCGGWDGGAATDCGGCAGCADIRGGLCDAGARQACQEISSRLECGSCPSCTDLRALADCQVPQAACIDCPEDSRCLDGHCYDCSQEGACNALDCEDDGNPCTLEVLDSTTGTCAAAFNPACQEALTSLIRIHRGASAYYGLWEPNESEDAFHPHPLKSGKQIILVQDVTPPEGTCCGSLGGPDPEGDGWCKPDPGVFNTPT